MRKKKLLPVPLLIIIDLLLIGTALCIYALFHHVLHFDSNTQEPIQVIELDKTQYLKPTPVPEAETAPEEAHESLNDWGQFGPRFYDKFTTGEIIQTENLYVSESVRIEFSNTREFSSDFHVLDIYIRNIENLRSAFAGGANDGTHLPGLEIAESVNAICSINGDFPGFVNSDKYLILRNGILYNSEPTKDALVLYYDGSVKVFLVDRYGYLDFDAETELANNAWQGWCFGPSLLNSDGTARVMNYNGDYYNPRTAFGIYEPGHYCFITVDGRSDDSPGVRLDELAQFCESLGLSIAYNMDGGQSSTMTFGDQLVNVPPPYEGVRKISDIIYIAEVDESMAEG